MPKITTLPFILRIRNLNDALSVIKNGADRYLVNESYTQFKNLLKLKNYWKAINNLFVAYKHLKRKFISRLPFAKKIITDAFINEAAPMVFSEILADYLNEGNSNFLIKPNKFKCFNSLSLIAMAESVKFLK